MARSAIYPPSVQPGIPRLIFPPKGWRTITFSALFEVVERPASLDDSKEYQLITAKRSRGGIVPRERLRGRDILTKTQFYVSEGDFLISNRQIIHGGCGIVPPALDGAIVSNEYTVLRPRPILRPDFLLYLPHSIYFQQTCFHASVGVDVEKMVFDASQWLTFKIHLPPVSEQDSIAELLLGVDDAIQATLAVVEQTRKIKLGVLNRLLTKGIGHSCFKQTEIGEMPKAWKVATVSDVLVDSRYGLNTPLTSEPLGVPVLRMGNIVDHALDFASLKYAELTNADTEKYSISIGDILFNRTNSRELVGKLAIANEDLNASFASYIIRLRTERSVCDPWFLHTVLSSPTYQDILRSIATPGASQANINANKLGKVMVPLPPGAEQNAIVANLKAFDGVVSASTARMSALQRIKSALMSDLLTGRKRITADALSPAL